MLKCVGNFLLLISLKPRLDMGRSAATVTGVVTAVAALPLWWTFKFQQDEMLRGHGTAFNTDSLDRCEMQYFWNGTCFEIKVGWHVQISRAPDGYCPKHHTKKQAGDKYSFRASTYGTQMYQSLHSCLPSAAHREFHFEIVDVRSQNAAFLSSGSSVVESECRTALRLAVDISNFKCHRTEDWDFDFDTDIDDFDFDWSCLRGSPHVRIYLLDWKNTWRNLQDILAALAPIKPEASRCRLYIVDIMLTGRRKPLPFLQLILMWSAMAMGSCMLLVSLDIDIHSNQQCGTLVGRVLRIFYRISEWHRDLLCFMDVTKFIQPFLAGWIRKSTKWGLVRVVVQAKNFLTVRG